MTVESPGAPGNGAIDRIAAFVVGAVPPAEATQRAALATLDTVGVTLAGAIEPAARAVQDVCESTGACTVFGSGRRVSAAEAALANGTAAHALDYDDMCFVSLAHPSAPLVPAILAAAETTGASGAAVLDAYAIGFEVQARLGRTMNPRHYERGWHCTSTLGVMSAAAAASRLLGLDANAAAHALAIAASAASGLKENFGTMVKPLHAGLAARDGVLAARLAAAGLAGSRRALDGAQGFLHAFDSQRDRLDDEIRDLGARWEIVESGVTVKLYPSCAGTHPTLDVVLDLRDELSLTPDDIERLDVDVDSLTPGILLYAQPATGLEAKFSLPFCVAAALVFGHVGVETFAPAAVRDPRVTALMPRISMRVDPAFDDGAPALTRARVHLRRRTGEVITRDANGARGYPARPASASDLDRKFLTCATRVLSESRAQQALGRLRSLGTLADIRDLTALLRML